MTGGKVVNGFESSTEIIDMLNPQKNCSNLSPYPGIVFNSVAGMDKNNQVVVCGGLNLNLNEAISSCYTLLVNNGNWISSSPLTIPRTGAAYTKIETTSHTGISILVAGGMTGKTNLNHLCSMEGLNTQTNNWTGTYIVNNVATEFSPLTECADKACMVQLNSTHMIFTGGYLPPGNKVNNFSGNILVAKKYKAILFLFTLMVFII